MKRPARGTPWCDRHQRFDLEMARLDAARREQQREDRVMLGVTLLLIVMIASGVLRAWSIGLI